MARSLNSKQEVTGNTEVLVRSRLTRRERETTSSHPRLLYCTYSTFSIKKKKIIIMIRIKHKSTSSLPGLFCTTRVFLSANINTDTHLVQDLSRLYHLCSPVMIHHGVRACSALHRGRPLSSVSSPLCIAERAAADESISGSF